MEYSCLNNTVTRMLFTSFAGHRSLSFLAQSSQRGSATDKAAVVAATVASRRRYWQSPVPSPSIKPLSQPLHYVVQTRDYATHKDTPNKPSSHRRQVTLMQDNGQVRWAELSTREKFARGTQQSINFSMVVVGALLTVSFACPSSCVWTSRLFILDQTNVIL